MIDDIIANEITVYYMFVEKLIANEMSLGSYIKDC